MYFIYIFYKLINEGRAILFFKCSTFLLLNFLFLVISEIYTIINNAQLIQVHIGGVLVKVVCWPGQVPGSRPVFS